MKSTMENSIENIFLDVVNNIVPEKKVRDLEESIRFKILNVTPMDTR